jgi:subtilase family serine protease
MAIAMAPGLSKVVVFEATNGAGYFDDILDSMTTHSEIKQFSTSWALSPDGPDPVAEEYFEKMIVQGQTFFCASGDRDAYSTTSFKKDGNTLTSTPSFPESDTNLTDVGGTELGMNSSTAAWTYDTVWNTGFDPDDELYWGSSGGVSQTTGIPSWQKGLAVSNKTLSTTMRNIPDVALTADSVFIVMYSDTGNSYYGYLSEGTSCASPLWAGFNALVNQQSVAAGGQPDGFINRVIYSIGQGARYSSDFHDVTVGNNFWGGSQKFYSAVSGYDLTTGWGTPNGQNLINDLSGTLPSLVTKGITNNLPTAYSLYQNYPNPFNPSTIIQYQIPSNGVVTIKVFDILGREMSTLVNNYKAAGNYSVTFDASKLASGVYFYRLNSGNYISTKKMLLLK